MVNGEFLILHSSSALPTIPHSTFHIQHSCQSKNIELAVEEEGRRLLSVGERLHVSSLVGIAPVIESKDIWVAVDQTLKSTV